MHNNTTFLNSPQGRTLILIILALGITLVTVVLAGNQILFVLLVIMLSLAGLVFLARPDNITLAVLFVIYTNAAVIAVKLHSLPFIIGASTSLLLAIPFVFKLVFQHQKPIISLNLILLLGFLFVQLLGNMFSRDVNIATGNLISFISEGIILYFLIVNNVRTPEMMRRVIWTLLIAGTFLGGLSLYQQITGTFSNNYWGFAQANGVSFGTGVENLQGVVQQNRVDGPLGEKNYYAQMMLVLIPLGLFRLQGEGSKILRWLAGIATMAIFIGIVLTFSRGVVAGFAFMLLVMILMRYIKVQQVILVVVAVFLLFRLFPQFAVRLSSLQSVFTIAEADSAGVSGTDTSTQGRIGEMKSAWLVFLDYPFIGVGPGMFKYYYPEYIDRVALAGNHTGTREAHDIFLGIAADHGLIGLSLFLFMVIGSLRNLEKVRKRTMQTHPDISNMAAAFFMAIISYLAAGVFLTLAFERYFWLILGLADALFVIVMRSESFDSSEPLGSEALPNSVR